LESESDKDMPAIMQLRLHFARFLYKMIASVPGESLFTLSFVIFSKVVGLLGIKAPEQNEVFSIHIYNISVLRLLCAE